MALYSALQKFITKEGAPVEGANVLVRLSGSTTAAMLYTTRTGTSKSNPFTTLANGEALCYVEPGRYDMIVTKGADQVTFADVEVGPVSFAGTFAAGGVITSYDQLFVDDEGGRWQWGGALNKTVAPGEDPTEVDGWTLVVDAGLRSGLADDNSVIPVAGVPARNLGRSSKAVVDFAIYNPPNPDTSMTAADSLLRTAAADAVAQGLNLLISQPKLRLNLYENLGDVALLADNCEIIGVGYPRAREVRGFRKSGLMDGEAAIRPARSSKAGKKLFYVQSAGTVWFVTPKANKTGGVAVRLQQTGAPTLSGSGDVGTPWQRWRQTLVYDLTMAFLCRTTIAAESGTWTNSTMTAALWREYDGGTNLLLSQFLRSNNTAAGAYIEYQVTTDGDGGFNVGLHQFSSASDTVEVKDQTNGIVIATLDLRRGASSTADGYRVYEFNAPKMGTFTLRLTNNGVSTTDLRVIGVNIQKIFHGTKFNEFESYTFINWVRRALPYLNSGSAATPVFSVRQGGTGGTAKTGGSIHGGETLNTVSWRKDGVELSSSLPSVGSVYMGDTFHLRQETTINWPDGQTCNYYEDLEFVGPGAIDATFSMQSTAGLWVQNIYNGMCPVADTFTEIVEPNYTQMAAPGASDVTYYPAVDGENYLTFRDPSDGKTVQYNYTVYPNAQVRGYIGGVAVVMRSVGNDDCKFYAPQYLGADKLVYKASGRAITKFG